MLRVSGCVCMCVKACVMALFMDSDFASHEQNHRDTMEFKAFVGEQDRCKGEFETPSTKYFRGVL